MTPRPDFPTFRAGTPVSAERTRAARQAIAICANADRLARDAAAAVGVDDEHLLHLLAERERMLADLAEHLVILRLDRPNADHPSVTSGERVIDEADALVGEVCDALSAANRSTMTLATRIADRTAELRAELGSVQRAGQAVSGYAALAHGSHVDRVR